MSESKLGTYKNRFDRWPNGAVPQNAHGRTPEQQLAYLDEKGFVAKRERAKLLRRIEEAKKPKVEPQVIAQPVAQASTEPVRPPKVPGRKSEWRKERKHG